jgi:hypothetical protein
VKGGGGGVARQSGYVFCFFCVLLVDYEDI